MPRWLVRLEVRAGRWQAVGRQVVVLHNGPLTPEQTWWVALVTVGRRAALAGVTALQAGGALGLSDTLIHVITPKGSTPAKPRGVRVHESRRFREEGITGVGVRRQHPASAAVHAALWARTDRQATYFLVLTVQQRLASVAEVSEELDRVRRHGRLRLLRRVLVDLAGGVQSLGELDVAAAMRARGLPEPDRQSIRRRPSGTEYLDCDFPAYGITLEIDGAGHDEPDQQLSDLLRDITLTAEGRSVVRIKLVAWRLGADQVLDRLAELFAARGWSAAA